MNIHSKIVLSSICILLQFVCAAYAKDLYLISGVPTEFSTITYSTDLYKIDNGNSIKHVVNILPEDKGLEYLRCYHDHRFILAKDIKYFTKGVSSYCVINMGCINEIKYIDSKFNFKKNNILWSQLCNISNKGLYIFERRAGEIPELNYYNGYSLNEQYWQRLDSSVNKNVILPGRTAGELDSNPYVDLFYKDGHIYTPYEEHNKDNLIWQINLKNLNQSPQYIRLHINTQEYAILSFINKSKNIKEFFLLYKDIMKWKKISFEGNGSYLRIFGDKLVVIINFKNDERLSTGFDKRMNKSRKKKISFDLMTKSNKKYYPGKILVYDISNNKTVEWDTGQGDSEIILIEDNIVIVRIYDELWKATLDNNDFVDKELLVKDDIVPDIHWAYYSETDN